ncbi:MAG: SDR family oxidoreductase [Deltaproteobacteria bacterium]|nr:SDR family oxidoreductase [Deltaproteobacteria bacterium]
MTARAGRHILVTGFPSFLARRLIAGLCQDPLARVTVLVQERFLADAELARDQLSALGRVDLLIGDVVKIDFGLSGAEIGRLASSVEEIYHFAADSFFGETRHRLFDVNVTGTMHALDVARVVRRLRRFVHLSSIIVAGRRAGRVLEGELDGRAGFHNAVEESKFRAEQKVRARLHQLPITIVRPGLVVGDSETGEIDRMSGPYLVLRAVVDPPFDLPLFQPGAGNAPFQLVPVDYVVDATLAIARHANSSGKTFHIVDPHALPAHTVVELVARAANRSAPLVRMPALVARQLTRLAAFSRFFGEMRAAADYFNTRATFDSQEADRILTEAGVTCPGFESYVDRLVAFIASRSERAPEPRGDLHDPLF